MKNNSFHDKEPIYTEAEQFIEAIAGSVGATVTFQVFSDKRNGSIHPEIIYGNLKDNWNRLVGLNEAGAGIFLMVNAGDGNGRSTENVTAVRSLFADLDGAKVKMTPVKPHVIVQSSPGRYHLYWKIDPIQIENGDRPDVQKTFAAVQEGIAEYVDGDPSVKDLPRVMRLPGFKHQKYDPFLTRIIKVYDHPPFKLEEVTKGFDIDLKGKKEKASKKDTEDQGEIPEGRRNDSVYKYCERLARLGLTEDEILLLAFDKAHECADGSHEYTGSEVADSVESALKHSSGGLSGEKFEYSIYLDEILMIHTVMTIYEEPHLYRDGVYEPWNEAEIKKLIWERSNRTGALSHINNTVELLKIETYYPADMVNPKGLLNTQTGILNPETGELKPHSSQIVFTIQLRVRCEDPPTGSNLRKPNCPRFQKFLNRVLPDRQQQMLIWEMLGYFLTTDCRYEKAFLLLGWGHNGKTVMLDVIRAMLSGYISEVRLTDLNSTYRPSLLQNKLLNISAEGETCELVDDVALKSLISGEDMTIEKKYKDPIKIKPYAKLLIAANSLPRTRDKSRGYFRRWIPIDFSVEIPEHERDELLSEKIMSEELDEIFYGALLGLRRLRKNRRFTNPDSSQRLLEDYQRQTNPVISFIDDTLKEARDAKIQMGNLYSRYKDWCELNGHRNPMTKANLKSEVEREAKRRGWLVTYKKLGGGYYGFQGFCSRDPR